MHLQDKIYEAIQKGLAEALDFSFDDEDNNSSVLTKKRVSDGQIVKPFEDALWIKNNFVDLGLPSGTLWCKYNLGATCGDTKESWYGHYYMWGSVKPNDNDCCSWKNAPFNNGADDFDSDYFDKHMYEFVDHNGNLLPVYDIAHQTNNLMHIPTEEQERELARLPNEQVKNYNNIDGLNGRVFVGTNGNTLFIPMAGWRYQSIFYAAGSECNLWSSSLRANNPSGAYYICFGYDGGFSGFSNECRYYGFSVRPVLY